MKRLEESSDSEKLSKSFVCADPPTITPLASGAAAPSFSQLPMPIAFFPLSGENRCTIKTPRTPVLELQCQTALFTLPHKKHRKARHECCAGYHLNSEPRLGSGGNFSGAGYNIMWTADQDVGIVAECSKVSPALDLPLDGNVL